MKKFLFSLAFAFTTTLAIAQFGTAHDFTVTDINGEEFHLYEHLDAGKVVVLDVSATWCPPCWSFHQTHILQDLHDAYGPDGTDQIRVIFYEGDPATGDDDLNGNTAQTLGDLVGDATYPIVNENPVQLQQAVYFPLGFPTVSVIRPGDYEITHDVYQATDISTVEDAINESITLGEVSSIREEVANASAISIFPTPVSTLLTVDLTNTEAAIDNALITNMLGQIVATQKVATGGTFEVNVADLETGFYFVNLQVEGKTYATKKFTKQ